MIRVSSVKRIKFCFFIFIILCMCCACGKSGEAIEDSSHKTEGSDKGESADDASDKAGSSGVWIPETYERTEENVHFKADVICPDEVRDGSVKIPQVSLQMVNEEKVIDTVYKDAAISKDEVKEYQGEAGEVLKVRYVTGEAMQSLSVFSFGASYTTAFYRDYINHSFELERNGEKYSTEDQLSFMDTDSAWNEVSDMLGGMEISLGEEPSFRRYALDYQTMAAEEYVMDMDGNIDRSRYKPEWTAEDEGYYFCIWQTCNGMKIHSPYSEMINKYADFNAPVHVMLSANGIEELSLGKTFLIGPEETVEDMAGLDDIADKAVKKFSMILTDAAYTIDRMELCYYPREDGDGNYGLKSVWIMNITEEPSASENGSFQMMIDAVSGEELY